MRDNELVPVYSGLGDISSGWAERGQADHEAEVHELHVKIGQLTMEQDLLSKGLKR